MAYVFQVDNVMNLLQIVAGIVTLILISVPQRCAYYGGFTTRLFDYGVIMTATVLALFTFVNSLSSSVIDRKCLAVWNLFTGIAVLVVGVLLMAGLGVHLCTYTLIAGLLSIAMAVFFFVEAGFRFT
ncbi:hypothetical protein ACOME3_002925 [Neoechinorhynchus agilis]